MAAARASKELARFPVGALLWKYSVPAIVGMMVMALYNVVDRLYVGRCVGADGLAGIALTFPSAILMMAFGLLIGVGTATRISIAMGQGKRRIAECYLGQAVCVYLFLSFVVYPVCAWFAEPIVAATGGTASKIKNGSNTTFARAPISIVVSALPGYPSARRVWLSPKLKY